MGQIKITAPAITKEEQLDIGRLLLKAGYTVSIKKGKTVNGKGAVLSILKNRRIREWKTQVLTL